MVCGWAACFLCSKDTVCLLSRANQHCPSPECFVLSIQPAVCYQAITKKLKVCEEVRQIFALMDFLYCHKDWQFLQSCMVFFFFFRKQDPPPSRQQTAQQSMAVSHPQTKSKISNALQPFPFLFLLFISYTRPLSILSLRINKPNISL